MELTKHCMVAYGPEHNTDMLIYAARMAGMVRTNLETSPFVVRKLNLIKAAPLYALTPDLDRHLDPLWQVRA